MRRQRTLAVAVLAYLVAAAVAVAQPTPTAGQAQKRLTALLGELPSDTQVGLVVADADSGATWFTHLPDTPLKPASLQKLLVSAAALERFGAEFRYETRAYLMGSELWVVGAGDPGLGDARIAERHGQDREHLFDEWAAALRARGTTELSGIVLDDSIFEPAKRHPDWPKDQADRWYQAPASGLNINDNCLNVRIDVRGVRVELVLHPELPARWIDNRITVSRKHRPRIRRAADSDVFEAYGTAARDATLRAVSARRPTVFFGHALKQELQKRGIDVRGKIVTQRLTIDKLPADALLATHVTSLRDVLWRCNTSSQNLFADCLLKSLAAYEPDGRRGGTPGSWDGGRRVLKQTLGRMGVDLSAAEIRDGCGLSHSNRVSAAQLVRLLCRMRRHRHATVFMESLAEPGRPGSMQNRYDDPALRGRLRAKTGTIAGVRCLAGYVTRPDGPVLAFALLINGKTDRVFPKKVALALVGGN